MASSFKNLLVEFAEALSKNFGAAKVNPAQPEDQLKAPTQRLIEAYGESLGSAAVARTEAKTENRVRPDLGVSVDGLLTGHIELKAPGKGVVPKKFKSPHDRKQFKKLSDHPNLIYTDGNDWALYRQGKLVGRVARAHGDVTLVGSSAIEDSFSGQVEEMLRDFLAWEPMVPTSPRALAELLAPLTRLLRESVETALADPLSAVHKLAGEWRDYFFAEADDEQFADAYAQTVTYALLLARVEGEVDLRDRAVQRLEARHALLAHVLRWLADPVARAEVATPVDLLERVIARIDPEELARKSKVKDLWLYFYEDFLAAYDPKGRKQRGVYYTPAAVVHAQVALVDDILRSKFEQPLGLADDGVTLLDPAVGTGTYLLEAIDLGTQRVAERYGAGEVAGRASRMAERFYGFEILIGAYAVCHMRLAQKLLAMKAELPDEGLNVFLTDTLESPNVAPPGAAHAPLFHKTLAEEGERARKVKHDEPILVCLGNPPYYRQTIDPDEDDVERQGGWVRYGDRGSPGAEDPAILNDYLEGIDGTHAKSLYNLYVYFWRWAMWKVFERPPNRGLVSFITASSFLRGPGFEGMRRHMRETFDELWIIDLGGEGRGARKSENVFDIQTPVAIAVGLRTGAERKEVPATVRYARLDGTREGKYEQLWGISALVDVEWRDCFKEWTDPMLPAGEVGASYYAWPKLTDLFPWQHSGMQFKRTWPIAPDASLLEQRWKRLTSAPEADRPILFRESRDRQVSTRSTALDGAEKLVPIAETDAQTPPPPIVRFSYRSLDRQYCLADNRLGDFLRPVLWMVQGPRQLYMTSLVTNVLGDGPAAIATNLIPDMDHFRGSYGAKHVIPLWRDRAGREPNVLPGLSELLRGASAEDVFAYTYAILQAPSYASRFAEELEIPGPRIPIAKDAELFERAVDAGRHMIWLHTFGERFAPSGKKPGEVKQGEARSIAGVGAKAGAYPESFKYDEQTNVLKVGKARFGPVSKSVWEYQISGLFPLRSWLSYRMKAGAGKKSSPLDAVRPTVWPGTYTDQLLDLIWTLEGTVAMHEELDEILDDVIEGETFTAHELPVPTDDERKPPKFD